MILSSIEARYSLNMQVGKLCEPPIYAMQGGFCYVYSGLDLPYCLIDLMLFLFRGIYLAAHIMHVFMQARQVLANLFLLGNRCPRLVGGNVSARCLLACVSALTTAWQNQDENTRYQA